MAIKLYHTESQFSDDPTDIILPLHPLAQFDTDDPGEVFRLSQHGVAVNSPWYLHPAVTLLIRSTSVGDVMELSDRTRLIVARLGFKPMPDAVPATPLQLVSQAQRQLYEALHLYPLNSDAGRSRIRSALKLVGDALTLLRSEPNEEA